MKQNEILEMARRAGFHEYSFESQTEQFNRFAKLVAEKQQRTWVRLTDKESLEIQKISTSYEQAVELTEAKLMEKNSEV
jgi:hypothetical protein